jgi:hypothetical protein
MKTGHVFASMNLLAEKQHLFCFYGFNIAILSTPVMRHLLALHSETPGAVPGGCYHCHLHCADRSAYFLVRDCIMDSSCLTVRILKNAGGF